MKKIKQKLEQNMNLLKKETVIEMDAGLLQKKCMKKILAGILCC